MFDIARELLSEHTYLPSYKIGVQDLGPCIKKFVYGTVGKTTPKYVVISRHKCEVHSSSPCREDGTH